MFERTSPAMTDIPSPSRSAASVIVIRHNPAGAPHVLMIERAEGMQFAGGAMVFPGGGVDDMDREHAALIASGGDVEELAARIAAVRETIEECGLALGISGGQADAGHGAAFRAALKSGMGLAHAAAALGLALDFSGLIPFARWCPPVNTAYRRYDTRFFLAVIDEVPVDLAPDGSETVRLVWHTAREVLDEDEAGRARIIFPTRRNLERLAQYESIEALVAHTQAHRADLIEPWVEVRGGIKHLCIPEGLGYPVTAEPLSSVQRI